MSGIDNENEKLRKNEKASEKNMKSYKIHCCSGQTKRMK